MAHFFGWYRKKSAGTGTEKKVPELVPEKMAPETFWVHFAQQIDTRYLASSTFHSNSLVGFLAGIMFAEVLPEPENFYHSLKMAPLAPFMHIQMYTSNTTNVILRNIVAGYHLFMRFNRVVEGSQVS